MLSPRKKNSKGLRVADDTTGDIEQQQHGVPSSQTAVLLYEPRQAYHVVHSYPVPDISNESEVLVRVRVIGLNPIDWKGPDFNFGIPQLPYVSGRELSGDIRQVGKGVSDWRVGDKVIAISTDYRDNRKGAYQQYAIALDYNIVKLPPRISYEQGSTLGVAFVAIALGLGVSLGLSFVNILEGPDLFQLVRTVIDDVPQDVAGECFDGIHESERLKSGDWLVIWGGSSTSANLAIQLARLAGVKTIAVLDTAKHGLRLFNHKTIRPDLLVDSHDPERAIDIIRQNTNGQVRFGIDTRGKKTASHLLQILSSTRKDFLVDRDDHLQNPISPPDTPEEYPLRRGHLIGMSGLPKKTPSQNVLLHSVPIKLFHEVPSVGVALCRWLERLLEQEYIHPPDIVGIENGLDSINLGLDRMRKGHISGGKLVVQVS